jgi:hypothetical protein
MRRAGFGCAVRHSGARVRETCCVQPVSDGAVARARVIARLWQWRLSQ